MKGIIITVTWATSFFSCILFSVTSVESSKNDIVISLVSLTIMLILIVLQIFFAVFKKQKANVNGIINATMPLVYCLFLLFRNYINFGYGNTLGILGYSKQIGILSMFNITRTAAFFYFCFLYLIITILFSVKYWLLIMDYTNKKGIAAKLLSAIIVSNIVIMVIGISNYFNTNRLSGLFILSSVLYWCVDFIIFTITKQQSKVK